LLALQGQRSSVVTENKLRDRVEAEVERLKGSLNCAIEDAHVREEKLVVARAEVERLKAEGMHLFLERPRTSAPHFCA
jgi:hypothetical protein